MDGAGSYGQNGAEDAACDAALLSRAVGRPVRVQWMREDEHGWDPKGPPQLLDLRAAVGEGGEVVAWETQAWLPLSTQGLPNLPLLAPIEAGLTQPLGRATGQIQQNIDPPYRVGAVHAVVHWLEDSPFRTSPIRAPGKVANIFAVESFVDEVCALAKVDPVEYRLRRLADPRGQEVLRRAATRMGWQPRPSPRPPDPGAAVLTGRGISYVHYKHNETYVAIGMEVAVERATGVIRVTRVVCAQDCGLMINPDNVASQLEGNILQTLSRTLHEEIVFDRQRVTSLDWASYPILRFDEVPTIELEMIQRLDDAAARRRGGRLGGGTGRARQRRLRRHGHPAARGAVPAGPRQGGAGGDADVARPARSPVKRWIVALLVVAAIGGVVALAPVADRRHDPDPQLGVHRPGSRRRLRLRHDARQLAEVASFLARRERRGGSFRWTSASRSRRTSWWPAGAAAWCGPWSSATRPSAGSSPDEVGGRPAGAVTYTLESAGAGTRFDRELVYASPTLLFAVLNRLGIRAKVERESAEAVRRLKAVLEAGPASAAGPGAKSRPGSADSLDLASPPRRDEDRRTRMPWSGYPETMVTQLTYTEWVFSLRRSARCRSAIRSASPTRGSSSVTTTGSGSRAPSPASGAPSRSCRNGPSGRTSARGTGSGSGCTGRIRPTTTSS